MTMTGKKTRTMTSFPGMEHQRGKKSDYALVDNNGPKPGPPVITKDIRAKALELAVAMNLPGPMPVIYTLETAERFAKYINTGEIAATNSDLPTGG